MKLLAVVLTFAMAASAAAPCTPKTERKKINQAAIQAIQRDKVNSAKELWRLDAKEVAQRECASLGKSGAPTQVSGTDKQQIFACGPATEPHQELTLKKPEWLLPYAGIYKMMMWVVTDVRSVCPKK